MSQYIQFNKSEDWLSQLVGPSEPAVAQLEATANGTSIPVAAVIESPEQAVAALLDQLSKRDVLPTR